MLHQENELLNNKLNDWNDCNDDTQMIVRKLGLFITNISNFIILIQWFIMRKFILNDEGIFSDYNDALVIYN